MSSLRAPILFIIVSQIIIAICQMISVIYCFMEDDKEEIRIFSNLTFIFFFPTVLIDIIVKYDFTGNIAITLIIKIILLLISGYFQFWGFFAGASFCLPFLGCSSSHPLNALHGIMVLVMIFYFIAYLCIVIRIKAKNTQQISQLDNPQLVNPLNYNDNVYYNINDNIIIPQNTENIKTTAN